MSQSYCGDNITCSIIMPCYNVEQHIVKAIESVLQQSMKDFELLIVIDGSPDSSQKIAEEFAKKDSRIKVLVKENGGVSSARNFGLKQAIGKYIYFIDPDDWVKPNLLEENINLLERNQSDLVVFGILNTYDGVVKTKLELGNKVITKGQAFDLQRDELKVFGYSWNKIYKNEIIQHEKITFDESLPLWEDCVFNFTYLKSINSYSLNSECYYYYNIYEGSASHKNYPDYMKFINAYEKASLAFIDAFNPNNKKQSYVYVYSLFLDVLYSELLVSFNGRFKSQFNHYFNKVKSYSFVGLSAKKIIIYSVVRYQLMFLLKLYRKIKI